MSCFEVIGARGKVDEVDAVLRSLEGLTGEVMMANARHIMGMEHAESAAEHAIRAFRRGENSARTLSTETLLYCAGERQISKALASIGLRKGDDSIALILFDMDPEATLDRLNWVRDDNVLAIDAEKERMMRRMHPLQEGISVQDLALERVAFLDINR